MRTAKTNLFVGRTGHFAGSVVLQLISHLEIKMLTKCYNNKGLLLRMTPSN